MTFCFSLLGFVLKKLGTDCVSRLRYPVMVQCGIRAGIAQTFLKVKDDLRSGNVAEQATDRQGGDPHIQHCAGTESPVAIAWNQTSD